MQPCDDLSCFVEATHMRIGRCEIAICPWKVRIVLHREEEFCHGLVEPPSEECAKPI